MQVDVADLGRQALDLCDMLGPPAVESHNRQSDRPFGRKKARFGNRAQ